MVKWFGSGWDRPRRRLNYNVRVADGGVGLCGFWLLPANLSNLRADAETVTQELKEGEDYYLNGQGLLVFTAKYLLKRGYCCQNGCRHCPYGFRKQEGAERPKKV
ncbi:hypothetical protein GCM10023188_26860 [Pontibacter saemangeumensis]|uniref:Uncharacterized protein n=1 Tax=Pontibacter saemangeumensis TaxID=1084525 RepID=A0ABP8LUY7_9BACT